MGVKNALSSAAKSSSATKASSPSFPILGAEQKSWESWDRHFDPASGHHFLHNPRTGETKWEEAQELDRQPPIRGRYEDMDPDAVQAHALPASSGTGFDAPPRRSRYSFWPFRRP